MLATNHVLAGIAIGTAIKSPVFSIPIALLSHIAMDLIPHWGKFPDRKTYIKVAKTDGVIVLLLFSAILFFYKSNYIPILLAAFAALFFDLDKPFDYFFGKYNNNKNIFGDKFLQLNIRFQNESYSRFYVEIIAFISLMMINFSLLQSV